MNRKLHEVIGKVQGVTGLVEAARREVENTQELSIYDFTFDFSLMKFQCTQIVSGLFTMNKMQVLFRYKIRKEVTRLSVLEAINDFNEARPLLKAVYGSNNGKNIDVVFSTDFIADDDAIIEKNIAPLISIMSSCPSGLMSFMKNKKISIVEK